MLTPSRWGFLHSSIHNCQLLYFVHTSTVLYGTLFPLISPTQNSINLNNVLIDNQHGFRSNHSWHGVTQLITFIEDVSYALDHQKQVDIILLDFSKAFNTVPHQRLLSKLKYYRITSEAYNWIQTWLTQHTQCVVLDSECSDLAAVLSGVPQETVLGP